MIQEFEQLLATNAFGNLEATKQHLLQKANEDRQNRVLAIEKDYQIARLIQFGLSLPRESPAYGISKGACNWYRRKYPQDDSTQKMIRKACWAIDHDMTERSGKQNGKQKHIAESGEPGTGEAMPEGISESVSAEEQRQGKEMEC